jgi:hypothetical protein
MNGPRLAGVPVLVLVAVGLLASGARGARLALAQEPEPIVPPAPESPEDAGTTRAEPVTPPPSVALSGAVTCVLASAGEATTVWRHGRNSRGPVDESTYRVRIAGGGAASDRLALGFSVGMLLPSLRPGSYASSPAWSAVAAVWARTLRTASHPDIEWGSDSDETRRPGAVTVTLASITPTSHASERQGGVTVDTNTFAVHGTVKTVVACSRSTWELRGICSPVTLTGTF